MYRPSAFAVDDRSEILGLLRSVAFGHLVTHEGSDADQPTFESTALPFVIDDELSSVRAHFSRANDHWKAIDGCHGLVIVPGVDAYVSPRWYPSKLDHGRVVPTWNYELINLHVTVEIHDDPEWTLNLVNQLTDQNEARVSQDDGARVWSVSDAPRNFIAKQIRAIVGVELHVERIEAKRKLSQNRREDDQEGAAEGLAESTRSRSNETAAIMRTIGR